MIELADWCRALLLFVPVQPIPVWVLLPFQCAAFGLLSLWLWTMLYIRDLILDWLLSGWQVAYCQFHRSMRMDRNRCRGWSNWIHCLLPHLMMAIRSKRFINQTNFRRIFLFTAKFLFYTYQWIIVIKWYGPIFAIWTEPIYTRQCWRC